MSNRRCSTIATRLCWVCLGTDLDGADVKWVSPCRCKGTLQWVHEECLQRWIDEQQKLSRSSLTSCSQCKSNYILSFPPVSRLVWIIEKYDKLLYILTPIASTFAISSSVFWCCRSYGLFSLIQLVGKDEAKRFMDHVDIITLNTGLSCIPITLILAKLIKWEDFILRLWRERAANLPKPFSYLIEPPPAQTRANFDQLLMDPSLTDSLVSARTICGALLLPTISSLVGEVFFSNVSESQWRRTLLGGLAFLLFKGAIKIYLRKSQYMRYSQRSIRNYHPRKPEDPHLSATTGDADAASRYVYEFDQASRPNEDDLFEYDHPRDQYFELQQERRWSMFSLTTWL